MLVVLFKIANVLVRYDPNKCDYIICPKGRNLVLKNHKIWVFSKRSRSKKLLKPFLTSIINTETGASRPMFQKKFRPFLCKELQEPCQEGKNLAPDTNGSHEGEEKIAEVILYVYHFHTWPQNETNLSKNGRKKKLLQKSVPQIIGHIGINQYIISLFPEFQNATQDPLLHHEGRDEQGQRVDHQVSGSTVSLNREGRGQIERILVIALFTVSLNREGRGET